VAGIAEHVVRCAKEASAELTAHKAKTARSTHPASVS
jgi:hypothetical protein